MNDRNRWIALVVLCTGMLMIVLDSTNTTVSIGAGDVSARQAT